MSEKEHSSSVMGFLAGAVVGGALGATVALLLAPQSGEQTRKMLKKKADELSHNIEDLKGDLEPKIKKLKKDLSKKFAK